MKKILSVFAAAAVLFGFASCSGDLHDAEPLQMTKIIGDMNGASADMVVSGTTSTYTFTYDSSWAAWGGGSGKMFFKVLKVWDNWATAGWGPDTETALVLNGDAVEGKQGGGQANFACTGLVAGTEYTITSVSEGEKVKVSLTGPEPLPAVDGDLSAINATTMAQVGAYFEIKGGSFGGEGKYNFNKVGNDYVARAVVTIPSGSKSGWSNDHYACWGKIGIGDGKTINYADKQWTAGKVALDTPVDLIFLPKDHVNFEIDEVIGGTTSEEVTYMIEVRATASGCTIKATKL
ncbi:MAG: hypothetical protein PUJ82_12255 [Spirochaetales bacterium]|nr:hypothetical protein [Spirochaetales bacterium]MDY5916181.1 hypothetical protein [Treponema sp.]